MTADLPLQGLLLAAGSAKRRRHWGPQKPFQYIYPLYPQYPSSCNVKLAVKLLPLEQSEPVPCIYMPVLQPHHTALYQYCRKQKTPQVSVIQADHGDNYDNQYVQGRLYKEHS